MLTLVYGGTFDPIHHGHVAVARFAAHHLHAEVRLLPAGDPPHRAPPGAAAEHRAAMVALAIAEFPGLRLDRRELERDGPSYMVDTLHSFRVQLGQSMPLALLLGADAFHGLPDWHLWRELFGLAHLVLAPRQGWSLRPENLPEALAEVCAGRWLDRPEPLRQLPAGCVHVLPLPALRPPCAEPWPLARTAPGWFRSRWPLTSVAMACIVRCRSTPGTYNGRKPHCGRLDLTSQAHVIKTRMPEPPPTPETLLSHVRDALAEMKARDAVEIDVRGKTSVADYMVVASGTSSRHVKSIAEETVKFAKRLGVMPLGVEGEREAEWVLVDLGDVLVHIMLPRVREMYALERLWTVGDQPPETESIVPTDAERVESDRF